MAAADIRLQIRTDELILNDKGGRSLHFHLLPPGQIAFSNSEKLWLASVSLKAENIALWVDPLPESAEMALHLFYCDHLGTPIGLINHKNGKVEWNAEIDVWGNVQSCDNPHKLRQAIRMQGLQYDEESGLHYNRHRYYDPAQGRYITQDPIGLRGGWNGYQYTDNPVKQVVPLGLSWSSMGSMTNQAGMKDAANAAQQQILEPWYINAGSYAILNETYNDMKRPGLGKFPAGGQ